MKGGFNMSKKEYLEELEAKLNKCNRTAAKDVMEDIKLHFEEAQSDGRSDEDIIAELGSIDDLVNEFSKLIDEEHTDIVPSYSLNKDKVEVVTGTILDKDNRPINIEFNPIDGSYKEISVDINCDISDVEIKNSTTGECYCEFIGGNDLLERLSLTLEEQKSEQFYSVSVTGKRKFLSFIAKLTNSNYGTLVIYVPYNVNKISAVCKFADIQIENQLAKDINLKTGSGDIIGNNFEAINSKVLTGSGDVEFKNVKSNLTVTTGSGDIKLLDIVGQKAELSTGSGDIKGRYITVEEVEVLTGSGDIQLQAAIEQFNAKTGSGSIEFDSNTKVNKVTIKSGSGDITLNMPEVTGMQSVIKTGSGDVSVLFKGNLMSGMKGRASIGDASTQVDIKIGSGDVKITV